uniref:Uncharacterized protein n=1 Tax=Populus trichocarpa TaxID=3694 RepID=A0A3N7G8Q3_POPTR
MHLKILRSIVAFDFPITNHSLEFQTSCAAY